MNNFFVSIQDTELMKPLSATISLLKEIASDENCSRMNKSTIKGYLGELITLEKLQQEGFQPDHQGNQTGYDILVDGIKIDVKTSVLKDDGFGIPIWGWTLSRQSKPVKYDIAICVALNEKLDLDSFYCISSRNEPDFRFRHAHFTNVASRFNKFPRAPDNHSSEKFKEGYEQSEKFIMNGKVFPVRANESLALTILKIK